MLLVTLVMFCCTALTVVLDVLVLPALAVAVELAVRVLVCSNSSCSTLAFLRERVTS